MAPKRRATAAAAAVAAPAAPQPFKDMVFCVSGNFDTCTQGELKTMLIDHGGTCVTTVSDACTHLITNGQASTKHETAKKKGVAIVNEQWALDRIKQAAGGGTAASPATASAAATTTTSNKRAKTTTASTSTTVFDSLVFLLDTDLTRTRSEIEALITGAGGKVVARISNSVTHLVVKDASSKKVAAAKERDTGICIVLEGWLDECVQKGTLTGHDALVVDNGGGDADDDADGDDDEEEEEDDDVDGDAPAAAPSAPRKKMIVPVDSHYRDAHGVKVVQDEEGIWDATLNQTNISQNNNKFYLIQLLESIASPGTYVVWTRWGRVGSTSQNDAAQHRSLDSARAAFCKKFKDKTGNEWADRATAKPRAGKYTLLERDYDADPSDTGANAAGANGAATATAAATATTAATDTPPSKPLGTPACTLPPRVQDLLSLISDTSMMARQMSDLGFDVQRQPLGKLTKEHIRKGYDVLNRLSEAVKNRGTTSARTFEALSSEFYTLIPHAFGMTRPPILQTEAQVNDKIRMVESLADIEVAMGVLQRTSTIVEHPLDKLYRNIRCQLAPIDLASPTAEQIRQYVSRTHASTHRNYTLDVLDVFEVQRDGETDRFAKFASTPNRQLLWHGSRLTNFVGILSEGLRIAPPSAPVTGYMFGKGVYFADMVSKSANYCFTSRTSNTACLLLCEVALGEMNELTNADYNASNLPRGKLSTKGLGSTVPNPDEHVVMPDGLVVPMGAPVPAKSDGVLYRSLLYNEYIVYDTAQIRIRYLLKVRFNYV